MEKNNSLNFLFFSLILLCCTTIPVYAYEASAIKGLFEKSEPLQSFELIDHDQNAVSVNTKVASQAYA